MNSELVKDVKEFLPHAKQKMFFEIPDSVFEALYGGSAGSGKSDALVLLPLMRNFHIKPRFKGLILRRTYPELEKEVIIRSKDWYPKAGATYNEQKRLWTFPSGAHIFFGYCEREADIRKYDSAEYNYVGFDELTSFTETMYKYITLTRIRTSDPLLPTIARSATNPGNVGHAWAKKHFVDPAPPGKIILDKKSGIKRIFIQALPTDNPYLDPNYVNRLRALNDPNEIKAKLEGSWDVYEGQVFNDFRALRTSDEPENACHVVEPFEIPSWWPRIFALDWGFSAMTYGLWGALSPDNRLYLYREYSCTEKKISDWAADVKIANNNEAIDSCVICRSSWQNRGEEMLLADQFAKITGMRPSLPNNDRIAGKLKIQDFLRWKQKPTTHFATNEFDALEANFVLRNKGQKAYEDYLRLSKPEEKNEVLPRLQIFSNLKLLIDTIPRCIYEKPNPTTGKVAEDVAEFKGDDPYDTLRYIILLADSMTNRATRESEFRAAKAEILQAMEQTQDMNTFYQRMAHLEHTKKHSGPRPVMIGKRGRR